MTFSINPNNRQNENLPANIEYDPFRLNQPTSIPPAPFPNYSVPTSKYSFSQPPGPGTHIPNWPGTLENDFNTTVRYSMATPVTQPVHTAHLHSEATAPVSSSVQLRMQGQPSNWPSCDPSGGSRFRSNPHPGQILSLSTGQHGQARSNPDSATEISMTVHENGSGAPSRQGLGQLPIRDIPAKKRP